MMSAQEYEAFAQDQLKYGGSVDVGLVYASLASAVAFRQIAEALGDIATNLHELVAEVAKSKMVMVQGSGGAAGHGQHIHGGGGEVGGGGAGPPVRGSTG